MHKKFFPLYKFSYKPISALDLSHFKPDTDYILLIALGFNWNIGITTIPTSGGVISHGQHSGLSSYPVSTSHRGDIVQSYGHSGVPVGMASPIIGDSHIVSAPHVSTAHASVRAHEAVMPVASRYSL